MKNRSLVRRFWTCTWAAPLLVACGLEQLEGLSIGNDSGKQNVSKPDNTAESREVETEPETVDAGSEAAVEDPHPITEVEASADAQTPDAAVPVEAAREDLVPEGVPPDFLSPSARLFEGACEPDEVVVGINVRAGLWTDAIGAICASLKDGVLGFPRDLPEHGNSLGGSPIRVTCSENHVATGVLGTYGTNLAFNVHAMIHLGVHCRDLDDPSRNEIRVAQSADQKVDDAQAFSSKCSGVTLLRSVTGTIDSNAYGEFVARYGGVCQ